MGFWEKVERVDAAVARFYARRKVWIWGVVSLPVLYVAGWMVWVMLWAPPAGGVTLIIHSKLDRPILGFSVNGMAGGNAAAHNPNHKYTSESGGATTCCGSVRGKTAEVIWTLDVTGPQYDAGMRPEQRRVEIPMPERKRGENDLHVHFLPGDRVLLGWSDNAFSPYDPRSPNHTPPPVNTEEQ
ncbi:hypothetical protein A9B99_22435 [Mangrovibacter phragmitis]|uniref:DUF3304 domain-containing protein n=1 Tax=Mangrovibacter phragmitis TaxID=1691903 RepID=A0A1B7L3G1_9ENTR|nr:DUF3304 domain-containing protein [Mangrovibacter phragmitis]OAT76798.1 hypothetical protein A9B99_22435 [Mangrovibacter phragmitis]